MLTKDIYGKTFSNYFNNAIEAYSQEVKPKIVINLLDSRHLSNVAITNSDEHTSNSAGTVGYYFTSKQLVNGYERESFTWAVTDLKEKDGTIIKADGRWHCMPEELDDGFEFGFWTKTRSQANGVFASSPTITMTFDSRKINAIKISTSEFSGQIKKFRVKIFGVSPGYSELYDSGIVTLLEDEYFKEFKILTTAAKNVSFESGKIELIILETKNPLDYGRVQEISPIYQVDITDYVIDYSITRTRDIHESSLPIGGSESPQISLKLDNVDKHWNIIDPSSLYGQYMKKDLKVEISTGWRIDKTNFDSTTVRLKSNMLSNATTMSLEDTDAFPSGGANNNFIAIIDYDNENREIVLCNSVTNHNDISIQERGYFGTVAVAHSAGAYVYYEPYEYVPMGSFYVDEWSSSASDMTVSISSSDWSKFTTEKKLDNGFILENKTVGEAVQNLLLRTNFPKANFKQILPYAYDTVNYSPVLRYSFSLDSIINTSESNSIEKGLRARFWGMRPGKEIEFKDTKANIQESQISVEKRSKSDVSFSTPDLIDITTDINSVQPSTVALSLENFTFQGRQDSVTYNRYFNGVIDGYYIPMTTGNQDIVVDIQNGGFRMYLDDLLIAEDTRVLTSLRSTSAYTWRGNSFLNLTAGVPYKIRIEFFHGSNTAGLLLKLYKNNSALNNKTLITSDEVRAVVAIDGAGSRAVTSTVPVSYDKYTINTRHLQNDAVILSNVRLNQTSSIVAEPSNFGILMYDGGYIRAPYHSSIGISEDDFTIETVVRFHNDHFSGDGEYLSTWANNNPSNGYEFFYNQSPSHGFKIKTQSGTVSVHKDDDIGVGDYHHIAVTYKQSTKTLSYYVDGVLEDSEVLTSNIVTQTGDITIGGRGAYYSSGVGEVSPTTTREFYIDEFAIYSKALSAAEVKNRYISSQIAEITTYPYLYGEQETIRSLIDTITLADLGRFYIDEEGYGRYEHYNRFFETSIEQHANSQYTFSDSTNIIDGNLSVQLQTNKVTVKVSSNATTETGTQPLWSPDDPTTLATVKLISQISNSDTSMYVSSTKDPVFSEKGYLIIDSEVIKYSSISSNEFLSLERGQLGTVAANHSADSKVRELRFYEIEYDKKPAINVKFPFITAIRDENPDLINVIKFQQGPYTANLAIAASNNNDYGSVVYAQGTHKLTEKQYFTSIAGTPIIVSQSSQKATEQVESLSEDIRKYGLKELTIDSPYIVSVDHAQKIAKFIIDKVKNPVPIINLTVMCVPKLQLGDRITISSFGAMGITNKSYWVISQEFSYSDTINHQLTLREVV